MAPSTLVTDAALYDSCSGAIITFENKTALVEHWPGAVTNTGNAAATGLVVGALGGEFPTWDGMVTGAEDFLARVVPTWDLQSGADVILAGMSAMRGPESFTFRIDDELPVLATQEEANASKYLADRPFKLVRLGKLVMAPVPHDQILPANWEGIADDADDAEVEWAMKKLITMQRHMVLPESIGGIGGFATITKITNNGIEQRTLLEWPGDRTGGRIRPGPIKWSEWHSANPRPGRVINLPARKRKRACSDRRGLTAQRLQMLGDLASADEKVRLVELQIIQARLQPGSLITDTDMQRIKDYAREQEALSREQTRLGYLGAAATDSERYTVRLHELNIALKYNKISQSDFNRAAFEAVPLFSALKTGMEGFTASMIEGFAKGEDMTKTLESALNSLSSSLIRMGSQNLIGNLFQGVSEQGQQTGGLLGGGLTSLLGLGATMAGPVGALAGIGIGVGASLLGNLFGQNQQKKQQEQQAQQQLLQQQQQAAAEAARVAQQQADAAANYRYQARSLGIDTSSYAGAMAKLELDIQHERAEAAKVGGAAITAYEQLAQAKRYALEKEWAEKIAQVKLSYEDRIFAATNDNSTLAGKLAEYDRKAAQERVDAIKTYGQVYVELEQAQAAERGKIIKDALKEQTDYYDGLRKTISDFTSGLQFGNLSALSPAEQFLAARNQFQTQYGLAIGGDRMAQGGITDVAQTLLEQARNYLGPSVEYGSLVDRITQQLGALPDIAMAADPQVQELQRIGDSGMQTVDQLTNISQQLQQTQAENRALQQQLAQLVSRVEQAAARNADSTDKMRTDLRIGLESIKIRAA